LTAALGLSQMKKLDKIIEMRRGNAKYLTSKLSRIQTVRTPSPPERYLHTYQMYTIRINKERNTRDKLRKHLSNKGIMTKVYFEPVHLTSFYRKYLRYRDGDLPVTEKISKEVLTLPLYPTLTKEEMDYVTKNIAEFVDLDMTNNERISNC